MSDEALTKEEFCRRFVDHMIKQAGSETFDDGESIRTYAEEVAQTYWDEKSYRNDGPEECADSDMSYWGE